MPASLELLIRRPITKADVEYSKQANLSKLQITLALGANVKKARKVMFQIV